MDNLGAILKTIIIKLYVKLIQRRLVHVNLL